MAPLICSTYFLRTKGQSQTVSQDHPLLATTALRYMLQGSNVLLIPVGMAAAPLVHIRLQYNHIRRGT